MEPGALSLLQQAREAYSLRAWADAFALLKEADRLGALDIEDLERLMWSAGMRDADTEFLDACERLFEACLAAGRDAEAEHWAFFHGFRLFALREEGKASAWMQRARQLVERIGRECAVSGYLLLPAIHRHLMHGDAAAAEAAAAQAVAIGERCAEPDLVAFGKCLRGRALARQGNVDEGVALLDEAMLLAVSDALSPVITGLVYCNLILTCRQVYALERSREWTEVLSHWCGAQPQLVQFNGQCLLHRAEIFQMDGAWQDALSEAQRAKQTAARAIAAETSAGAVYQEAEIHRLRGELDNAERGYRDASRLGLEPQPGLALLRLAQGRAPQAAATLRRVLQETAEPLARARLLPAAVEILIAAGAQDEAQEAASELQDIAARYATPVLGAIAAQARAEIALARADAIAALADLRAALSTWRRSHAPYIEARLRVRIGQACRMLGDEEGARLEFEGARVGFQELGAAPDRAHAAALAGGPRNAARDTLTPRELEVLGLIAAGQTNKRIAIRLGLSEKTVDRHVSNIFDKLEVSTRAAATALAIQRGLL